MFKPERDLILGRAFLFVFLLFFFVFAVFSKLQAVGELLVAGVRYRRTKSPFLRLVGCVYAYSKLQA